MQVNRIDLPDINPAPPFFPNRAYWLPGFHMAAQIVVLEYIMSPDAALVIFTSLGFASIFLALVIGITGHDPADIVAGIVDMMPTARRQAQFEQLDYMTKVADEAIEARRLGKRAPFPQDAY
jgi:hypothetical protein